MSISKKSNHWIVPFLNTCKLEKTMCEDNLLQPRPQSNFLKIAFFRLPIIAKKCAGDKVELAIAIKLLYYCVLYRFILLTVNVS